MKTFLMVPGILAALLTVTSRAEPPQARQAAQNEMFALTNLVSPALIRGLGFTSVDQLKGSGADLKLGEAFAYHLVSLGRLRAWQPGQDPLQVLSNTPAYIYPVQIKDDVFSAIKVGWLQDKWRFTGYGNHRLMRVLEQRRRDHAASAGGHVSAYRYLRVLEVDAHFLAFPEGNSLALIPLFDEPALRLRAGQKYALSAGIESFQKLPSLPRGAPN